jgi:hypothetical protein
MAKNTETKGQHQELHIRKFRSDRYGIYTGTIERHIKEDFDAPQWGFLSPDSAPNNAAGIPCVTVERDYEEKTGFGIYTYGYEGLPDNFNLDRVFCNLDGSDREEPIETSPLWPSIKTKYKAQPIPGSPGQFYFPPTFKDSSGSTVPNPLFGATHYMTVGMLWTRTYAVREVPQGLFSRVDTIDTPVGNKIVKPPTLKAPRNWLKLAPEMQQRGNVVQISERWMASGKNGFNPDVYSEKTAMGGGGANGNGLAIGVGVMGGPGL